MMTSDEQKVQLASSSPDINPAGKRTESAPEQAVLPSLQRLRSICDSPTKALAQMQSVQSSETPTDSSAAVIVPDTPLQTQPSSSQLSVNRPPSNLNDFHSRLQAFRYEQTTQPQPISNQIDPVQTLQSMFPFFSPQAIQTAMQRFPGNVHAAANELRQLAQIMQSQPSPGNRPFMPGTPMTSLPPHLAQLPPMVLQQQIAVIFQQIRSIFPGEDPRFLQTALAQQQFNVGATINYILSLRQVNTLKGRNAGAVSMLPFSQTSFDNKRRQSGGSRKPAPKKRKKVIVSSDEEDSMTELSDTESEEEMSGSESSEGSEYMAPRQEMDPDEVLKFFSSADPQHLQDMTGCSKAQAQRIHEMAPFETYDDLYAKLNETKGLSTRIIEKYEDMMASFGALDNLITKCQSLTTDLMSEIQKWASPEGENSNAGAPEVLKDKQQNDNEQDAKETTTAVLSLENEANEAADGIIKPTVESTEEQIAADQDVQKDSLDSDNETSAPLSIASPTRANRKPTSYAGMDDSEYEDDEEEEKSALHLVEMSQTSIGQDQDDGLIRVQPDFINPELTLKGYQLVGMSWLYLLYRKNLSGCLADSMGLGKTAQVISFLGLLLSKGVPGPHLVVVPSSTTENWLREFSRWCPSLRVRLYYGSQTERAELREELDVKPCPFNAIVTTYNMIGSKEDRLFLRKLKFNCMVLDEGHMVKNMNSQRYQHLMSIRTSHRFLLTGTPLQNNLQELISLLTFLMPDMFMENSEDLKRLFALKNHDDMIESKQRIMKAKELMKPFILRRNKHHVLKDLPKKTEKLIYCEPTESQMDKYRHLLSTSRQSYMKDAESKKKGHASKRLSNILMQLRKMACHPVLHRLYYKDDTLKKMTKDLMKNPEYENNNADYIFEDMTFMSDFELHQLCTKYPQLKRYVMPDEVLMDSGKVQHLLKVLAEEKERGSRLLLFSQFTMMLDVLETVLDRHHYKFLRIDGSTPVTERQTLIDLYYRDDSYFVFLLSTKAGGFGINLTAANVVIMHDLDFNPHNDDQAENRAHRVGQTKEVRIIKMVTKGTVEEQIYKCGQQKMKLDKTLSANTTADTDDQRVPATASKRTAGQEPTEEKGEEGTQDVDPSTIMSILRAEFMTAETEKAVADEKKDESL